MNNKKTFVFGGITYHLPFIQDLVKPDWVTDLTGVSVLRASGASVAKALAETLNQLAKDANNE